MVIVCDKSEPHRNLKFSINSNINNVRSTNFSTVLHSQTKILWLNKFEIEIKSTTEEFVLLVLFSDYDYDFDFVSQTKSVHDTPHAHLHSPLPNRIGICGVVLLCQSSIAVCVHVFFYWNEFKFFNRWFKSSLSSFFIRKFLENLTLLS